MEKEAMKMDEPKKTVTLTIGGKEYTYPKDTPLSVIARDFQKDEPHGFPYIAGNPELFRGNEDEADIIITAQGLDQGMDRAAEFQISADADLQVLEMSLEGTDGQKIRQRLRGMLMPAVAGIDDRNQGFHRSHERCAFLRMSDGCDIGVAGDDAHVHLYPEWI